MKEQWKIIPEFPKYEVSNFGEVRTVNNKRLLKSRLAFGDKYLKVSLGAGKSGKTKPKRVHRLVASAFCKKNKIGDNHVNHFDGNKLNNRSDNLRWGTQQENNWHSYHILGNVSPMLFQKGKKPANTIITKKILKICIKLFESGIKTDDIGKTVKADGSSVRKNLRKHYKTDLKSVKIKNKVA